MAETSPPPPRPAPETPALDMRALAEKVYRLMLEDIRIELARRGEVGRKGAGDER